jgi:hypothetical protein
MYSEFYCFSNLHYDFLKDKITILKLIKKRSRSENLFFLCLSVSFFAFFLNDVFFIKSFSLSLGMLFFVFYAGVKFHFSLLIVEFKDGTTSTYRILKKEENDVKKFVRITKSSSKQ